MHPSSSLSLWLTLGYLKEVLGQKRFVVVAVVALRVLGLFWKLLLFGCADQVRCLNHTNQRGEAAGDRTS